MLRIQVDAHGSVHVDDHVDDHDHDHVDEKSHSADRSVRSGIDILAGDR